MPRRSAHARHTACGVHPRACDAIGLLRIAARKAALHPRRREDVSFPLRTESPGSPSCLAQLGVTAGEFTGFPLLEKRPDSARLGALLLHVISVVAAPG